MCQFQGANVLTSFYVFILFLGPLDLISINEDIVKNSGTVWYNSYLGIYSQCSFLQ